MSRRFLAFVLVAVTLAAGAAGCGLRPAPGLPLAQQALAPEQQPAPPTAAASPASSHPPSPLPAVTATPASIATPEVASAGGEGAISTAPGGEPFFLGVPAGDAYGPTSVAADADRGLAYVYHMDSAAGSSAISVVDLSASQVLRLIPVGSAVASQPGRILLSPDGTQAYVIYRVYRDASEVAILSVLDPLTGTWSPAVVDDVSDAVLSADGKTLYARGVSGLRAFSADDLAAGRAIPLWDVENSQLNSLGLNGAVVAAGTDGAEPGLLTYNATTGQLLGRGRLPDYAQGVLPAPAGGWAVRIGFPPRLVRLDSDMNSIAEATVPYGSEIFYDAPRSRYLAAGPASDGSWSPVILALADDDLKEQPGRAWSWGPVPDLFAAFGDDRLLGLTRYGRSRLVYLDGGSLAQAGYAITGVRLTGMVLDEAKNALYVADDQDRVHALSLPGGSVRAVWHGSAPLALDSTDGRLYVNRDRQVIALETETGNLLARFPQDGMPAPDPQRDLLYIAQSGVTMYNKIGDEIGPLPSTLPPEGEMTPRAYAFAAEVNPVSGYVSVIFDNGIPGSNNGSFLRVYPPQTDSAITVPGSFSFVSDLVFDRETGNQYISYSPDKDLEALQALSDTGKEIGRLSGRTGALAFDPTTGILYVVQDGALARVDAETMTLRDLYRAPAKVSQVELDSGLGVLYVRDGSSRIQLLALDGLQPFDMRPVAVPDLPPALRIAQLDIVADGSKTLIYATTDTGEHYRSTLPAGASSQDATGDDDVVELNWEKLPVGSLPIAGYLTAPGNGVLFRANQPGEGSDGIFRSRDGGESWELLDAGLSDLRVTQPVLALSADRAYLVSRSAGVFAWQPDVGEGSWQQIVPPENDYGWPGQLSLAPDGDLFLQSNGRLRRSGDGGQTWQDLTQQAQGAAIVGFDPDYASTQTLFAVSCTSDICRFMRSRDGGSSYQTVLALRPYAYPLKLLSDRNTLYLYDMGYPAPQLYRSEDRGASWEVADPAVLIDTGTAAVAPDGWLWFGVKGGLRAFSPDSFRWQPASATTLAPISMAPPP